MKFILRSLHADAERLVCIPPGDPDPVVKRPELWIPSGDGLGTVVKLTTIAAFGADLFYASVSRRWQSIGDYPGKVILDLKRPGAGWEFTMDFLKLWLGYVFDGRIEFELLHEDRLQTASV